MAIFSKYCELCTSSNVRVLRLAALAKIKDSFEGELRRMGFKMDTDDTVSSYFLSILLFGTDFNQGRNCAVTLRFTLEVLANAKSRFSDETMSISPTIWEAESLRINTKPNMQKLLSDLSREMVNDLYLEQARAKD